MWFLQYSLLPHIFPQSKKFLFSSFVLFFFHLLSSHPFFNEIKDSHLVTGDL